MRYGGHPVPDTMRTSACGVPGRDREDVKKRAILSELKKICIDLTLLLPSTGTGHGLGSFSFEMCKRNMFCYSSKASTWSAQF